MTTDGGPETTAPPLPASIWTVGWAALTGQVVVLADGGLREANEVSILFSVLAGGLVVGWVAAGVVRARTFRLVLAWVLLVIGLVVELTSLPASDGFTEAVPLMFLFGCTVVAMAALLTFQRSDWYRWQVSRPPRGQGAAIGAVVTLGVLVGAVGGVLDPPAHGVHITLDL